MERVEILVFDGFDELNVVAPMEVSYAGFTVDLVTCEEAPKVTGAHGMSVHPDCKIGDTADLFVVPVGGWASQAPQSAWAEARRGVLPAAIAQRHATGTRVAGVCPGVMLLAASGILDGRTAITHRWALGDLDACCVEAHPEGD